MWAPEAGPYDDDPREIQRQREAYARELDHQIALRRARQQQEQMEREELERKLAPSDRSPSKWLVEGGQLDAPTVSESPWKRTQRMEHPMEQRQDRGAATGEANSVSSSHPRFRVTDESETSQRVRERAQQMQWRRILDDQVQEKARLKEQEEAKRRRSEEDAAREEVRYLREQQLRAQRRLGQFSPALNAASIEDKTGGDAVYHAVRSNPTAQGINNQWTSNSHNFGLYGASRNENDSSIHHQTERQYDKIEARNALLPPPAPSRVPIPQSSLISSARDENLDLISRDRTHAEETQASNQQLEQQRRMIEEYRSLLAEIRREREELRRERDEVRHEKEDLRVQRALLQLENEKMTSLVEAQRTLNEQHQADLQTQQELQARQLAQRQAQHQAQQQAQHQAQQQPQQEAQQHAQYQPISHQYRTSIAQPVGCNMNSALGGFGTSAHQAGVSDNVANSQLNQIRQSFSQLNFYDDQPQPVPGRRRKPPSPMSMAEFSALTPQKRTNVDIMDTPHFQRLSRYQPVSAVLPDDEDLLNQSLLGESVFVPLSPKSKDQVDKGLVPRTTKSPTSSDRQGDHRLGHPLRDSRVIKSRGFYDFEQELKSADRLEAFESGSVSGSVLDSDLGSSFYGDNDGDDGEDSAEIDCEKRDDDRTDSCATANSGLFKVQVLV